MNRSSWCWCSLIISIAAVLLLGISWVAHNVTRLSDLRSEDAILLIVQFPYFLFSKLLNSISTVLSGAGSIFLLLVVLAIVLSSKSFTRNLEILMWPFKSVKIFGTEIAFNREATTELTQGLSDVIKIFRHGTNKKLVELKEAQLIDEAMEKFEKKFRGDVAALRQIPLNALDFRVTIHLRDILFEHTFVQLTDYYPVGGGSGRRFSARYGIIGLTWRTGENAGRGSASVNETELIRDWAMFRDEARKRIRTSKQRPSLLSCIMKDPSGEPIGVLYIDSQNQNEFGSDGEAKTLASSAIPEWPEFRVLQQKVSFISDEIRTTTARVRIYDI